jgi:hypothetical protein
MAAIKPASPKSAEELLVVAPHSSSSATNTDLTQFLYLQHQDELPSDVLARISETNIPSTGSADQKTGDVVKKNLPSAPEDWVHFQYQDKLPKALLESICGRPPEYPPLTQETLHLSEFIKEHFNGGTPLAQKNSERLHNISTFFGIDSFVPIGGDGNCFVSAAIAGLLNHFIIRPSEKERITRIMEEFKKSHHPYILEDPSPESRPHNKGFNKDNDFDLVIETLKSKPPHILTKDEPFIAAFGRVLRYALVHNESYSKEDIPPQAAAEIDVSAICALNLLFSINAKVVVLEGGVEDADSSKSSFFAMIQGGDIGHPDANQGIDTEKEVSPEHNTADFLIIRKSNHFFCGIHTL